MSEKNIEFARNVFPLKQSDLIQAERYIQLETSEECLLSEITQLICTSKELFIFDLYTQSVYVFDYNGNYLRKMHKTGQGPGEYTMITAISLNEKEQRLSVVDVGKNILFYDMKSFDFIKALKIEAVAIEEIENNNYVTYNSLPTIVENTKYDYHVLIYNKEGKVKKQFLPIEFESGYTMRPIERFYRFRNSLFIYLPFTSQTYQIDQDGCVKHYNLEYENLSFPPLEYLEEIEKKGENYMKFLYQEKYIHSVQIFENENFLISHFYVGLQKNIGIYDKLRNKGRYFSKEESLNPKNDIDYLQIIGTHNTEFVSILKHDADYDLVIVNGNLEKIYSKEIKDKNPILLFFNINANTAKTNQKDCTD